MLLELFGFMNMSFTDILDILLVALLLYLVFRWLKDSSAMNIFVAILLLYLLMVVVDALHMKMMSKLMSTFFDVGVLAMIVIFQPEIRHFLMKLGSGAKLKKANRWLSGLFHEKTGSMDENVLTELIEAVRSMSEDKTGALIVMQRNVNLDYIIDSGDKIDANISRRLLMNLFFKNSPLHDGAVILIGDRVAAARCTLPITNRTDIPASFGMRHKAAIGITEETDADVVVVSEETGAVSFVKEGTLTHIKNLNELKLLLRGALSTNSE